MLTIKKQEEKNQGRWAIKTPAIKTSLIQIEILMKLEKEETARTSMAHQWILSTTYLSIKRFRITSMESAPNCSTVSPFPGRKLTIINFALVRIPCPRTAATSDTKMSQTLSEMWRVTEATRDHSLKETRCTALATAILPWWGPLI